MSKRQKRIKNMKKNVSMFMGGTCNGSTWRDTLIPLLNPEVDYFDPVVPDWTPECQAKEDEARKTFDYVLYVLTPKMTGAYSVAEVVDDSNKRPDRTLLVVLNEDGEDKFTMHQAKALAKVKRMVVENGAQAFDSLADVARFLNTQ
jgi:hypothetical protein